MNRIRSAINVGIQKIPTAEEIAASQPKAPAKPKERSSVEEIAHELMSKIEEANVRIKSSKGKKIKKKYVQEFVDYIEKNFRSDDFFKDEGKSK